MLVTREAEQYRRVVAGLPVIGQRRSCRPAKCARRLRIRSLASALPVHEGMTFRVGIRELLLSGAISVVLMALLDWPAALGAAVGVAAVPLVALATLAWVTTPADAARSAGPVRGLCPCGHQMSMHCHADCSGPCAVPGCECPGRE